MNIPNKPIKAFRGKHAFLSNFHPSPVVLDGQTNPTVEHAFQAAKTADTGRLFWVKQLL
jgi:hypothetical protein